MQLPKELHSRVAKEFRYAADRMRDTADPFRKVYYLSAFYAEAQRILNLHWDVDLMFIHQVILHTHQQISARLQSIASGTDKTIKLEAPYFGALTLAVDSLAKFVEDNGNEQELFTILKRFAELAYASTGNGYYLMEKGDFTL